MSEADRAPFPGGLSRRISRRTDDGVTPSVRAMSGEIAHATSASFSPMGRGFAEEFADEGVPPKSAAAGGGGRGVDDASGADGAGAGVNAAAAVGETSRSAGGGGGGSKSPAGRSVRRRCDDGAPSAPGLARRLRPEPAGEWLGSALGSALGDFAAGERPTDGVAAARPRGGGGGCGDQSAEMSTSQPFGRRRSLPSLTRHCATTTAGWGRRDNGGVRTAPTQQRSAAMTAPPTTTT